MTLSNLFQTYSGTARVVAATTTPSGLTVNLNYNGISAAPTNVGSYTVIGIINDADYLGSATNTLLVGLPPQGFIASMSKQQQLNLQLSGTPNYPYILNSATNLIPPVNWQPVITNLADANGKWNLTVSNLSNGSEFYRAMGQ